MRHVVGHEFNSAKEAHDLTQLDRRSNQFAICDVSSALSNRTRVFAFALQDRCTLFDYVVGVNISHLSGNEIASSELAIDHHVEHSKVARLSRQLELDTNGSNGFGERLSTRLNGGSSGRTAT